MDKVLCCYCGLQFVLVEDCFEHEENERLQTKSHSMHFCLHQNYLEKKDCAECNPYISMTEDNF
jgi:hypothetical protein